MGQKKIILFRPTASILYRQGEVPLQLLSIARMHMPEYDVHIVCSEVGLQKRPRAEVEKEIDSLLDDCLYFGVTAMTGYGLKEAKEICQWVRRKSPETKIVWGGWHSSLLPEQTLQEEAVDFVVVGQGEDTARELAEALEAGKSDFSHIKGLGWKRGDELVMNPPRPIGDIDPYPPLPYHKVDMDMFEQHATERMVGIITSVGCPLDCGFCADRAVYKGKWKRTGVQKTLDELKLLRDQYGVKVVKILDSNFFVDWHRGLDILRGMRELGMRAFWINARIPKLLKATPEDLKLFRDTVNFFLVGAESGSDETLQLVTKLQTVDDIKRVGKMYGDAGVPVCFSTLVGTPYEDRNKWKEEWDLTVAMIDELLDASGNLHTAQVHVYTPYPGTPCLIKAVKMGFDPPTELEGWANVEMFSARLPYLPEDLGERAEFLTTHVLQLLRPDYKFYRGRNPLARASFGTAQTLLKTVYKVRWELKYFDHPVEMRLIQSLLNQRATPDYEAAELTTV